MPEDSKKQQKGKHDPKEQRKSRRSGQKQAHSESRVEKKVEDVRTECKVTTPQKPEYESPGPEFYKNLKRETDEILKITEEENSKYKKKEIQSNWSKYEVPIESYEEIEEHENMGADYEKLIQAPLSAGGHFQFKHEKSWDMTMGPSLYDKYFDINMDNLSIALCTIPFYERNNADLEIFSETDIQTMNNRSTRFKQKYYNDKTYTTPELEAKDKIINSLKDKFNKTEEISDKDEHDIINFETKTYDEESSLGNEAQTSIDLKTAPQDASFNSKDREIEDEPMNKNDNYNVVIDNILEDKDDIKIDAEVSTHVNFNNTQGNLSNVSKQPINITNKLCNFDDIISEKTAPVQKHIKNESHTSDMSKVVTSPDPPKNPVMESPEDLEKWLDDFLDG